MELLIGILRLECLHQKKMVKFIYVINVDFLIRGTKLLNFVEKFIVFLTRVQKIFLGFSGKKKPIISLQSIPDGIKEIQDFYGYPKDAYNVRDLGFFDRNLVIRELKYSFRDAYTLKPIKRVCAHKAVIDSLIDALEEIVDFRGPEWLQKMDYDLFGGTYVYRFMRGQQFLSTHSFGIAIDWCPSLGRFGNKDDVKSYPKFIVDAFTRRGFDWGGNWKCPDGMHFQACVGY